MNPTTSSYFIAYSTALLEKVPVKHILDHAGLSPGFSDIYPDLLCCVANQFPELFDVNAALIAAGSRERTDMESRLTLKKPRRAIHIDVLRGHLQQPAEAARGERTVMYSRDIWTRTHYVANRIALCGNFTTC
jgi:hypothetical protein